MVKTIMCQDSPDRPGCEGQADFEYTMRFDDIGQPPIYWCEHCGREAHAMNKTIQKAFDERGPEFKKQFKEAIEKAEGTKH